MHMHDVMFAVVEGCRGCAFFVGDGLVAAVTDSHFELEAHQRDGGALGAALAADGLPTLAAMVLS